MSDFISPSDEIKYIERNKLRDKLKYNLSSNDEELLYLYLQSSMYRQPDNEIPLDSLLSRSGFANLTVCPRCRVDDFIHVEGCEFIPDI